MAKQRCIVRPQPISAVSDRGITLLMKLLEQDLVITRIFDAPRDLVWKAWADPEKIKRWWGPESFTVPFCRIDLRVGG